MKPRFLADADVNYHIVRAIQRAEPAIDIWSAAEGGVVGIPDPQVLSRAAELGRMLISHDRSTMTAAYSAFCREQDSPGLIIMPQRIDFGRAVEAILLIWSASEAEEWTNCIEFVGKRRL